MSIMDFQGKEPLVFAWMSASLGNNSGSGFVVAGSERDNFWVLSFSEAIQIDEKAGGHMQIERQYKILNLETT